MQSFEDPAVKAGEEVCASRSKSLVKESQASVLIARSNLGLQWPWTNCAMEAARSLAREFLAKIRVEANRIIFFGLGLKVDASSGIRRRLGRVLSQLGLKPKLLFGDKWRGRRKACGLRPRPRSLTVPVRIFSKVESSLRDLPEGSVFVAAPTSKTSPAKSWLWRGILRQGSSSSPEEVAVLSPRSAEASYSGESPSEMIKAGSGLSRYTQIVPEIASANLSLPELA
jgi:hypothetical protein